MLLSCCLQQPQKVWDECKEILSEDLLYISWNDPQYKFVQITSADKQEAVIVEIDKLLRRNGKSIADFPELPQSSNIEVLDVSNFLLLQELSYDKEALQIESDTLVMKMNDEQRHIYQKVMSRVNSNVGGFFFVYGYGGTGKTFLWNALTSTIRANGQICLTVASSGIAATLLPFGRIARSRSAIPIVITEVSMCSIKKNSPLSKLISRAKLIIWDKAPIRTLRDIMDCNMAFGGKCVIMGGDFHQILPLIPKGSRADIVNACINYSYLWNDCTIFQLSKNMRLTGDPNSIDDFKLNQLCKWLLDIGDGNLGSSNDGLFEIEIPHELLLSESSKPQESIVYATYKDLMINLYNNEYFNERDILAPTIEVVDQLNSFGLSLFPAETHEYFSSDSICKSTLDEGTMDDLYTVKFLNTIHSSGLARHGLILKVGAPIMLLRNIDQSSGLCNGTRLRVSNLGKNVIEAITLNGSHPNKKVVIHRIYMNPSDSRLPFKMKRRQFPIVLLSVMTINKSQGKSLNKVGLYLEKPVFSHSQLYVALSRVKKMDGLIIYVPVNRKDGKRTTINVVYKDIFNNVKSFGGN